ncbi:MAG: sulfatase [Pirellulaceae bacterium]|nr:sulfatase [Pirellulaceae bacterium]
MQRRSLPASLLMAVSFLAAPYQSMEAADQPNVVFVLVDDLGWMDLSCQGSDYYKTPHIDQLAQQGTRFTNAYAACAVCSPTRASVITGRWPARVGVTDWIRARFQRGNVGKVTQNPTQYVGGKNNEFLCPPNPYFMEHAEVTMAELLRGNGYKTCFVGKWHLGDPEWYPPSQGFDINVGGCDIGQPPNYFDPYTHPKYSLDKQLVPRKEGEFLTYREADEAAKFIRECGDSPFLLYYCPYAVHTPIQAIESVAAKYRRDGKTDKNAKYAAMVESVDDAVGTIVETLTEKEIRDNTLIIFTSDNGGLLGPTDNTPLRSGKGYAYEGGIRVPAIACWPGVIPAGVVSDLPISSVDYLPTVCEATQTEIPSNVTIDGVSLMQHLKSSGQQTLQRRTLYWHFPHYRHPPGPYSIIRDGDWKLIRWYAGPTELYNLADDLGEQNDLADAMPAKADELTEKLEAYLNRVDAKVPQRNPDFARK